jgi:formate hydrogenlyase subunit 3/multisubunit Na+/H+ antiporter MnhD subunit
MGMILNMLQPLVLGGLILGLSPRTEYTPFIVASMVSYLAYGIYYTRQYTSNLQCTQPKEEDPHLVWTVMDSFPAMWFIYIATVFIIAVFGMPTMRQGLQFGGLGALTMLISILVYQRQDVGAMWCFFTSFIPLSYYISRKVGFL